MSRYYLRTDVPANAQRRIYSQACYLLRRRRKKLDKIKRRAKARIARKQRILNKQKGGRFNLRRKAKSRRPVGTS